MATVHHWTGLEARALRLAVRMSVRAFAEHLGVGVRTVSKWEKLLAATAPRPDTQAILDTALARADTAAHLRFETTLSDPGRPPGSATATARVIAVGPRAWEFESWTDDLDRAVVALSRQNFTVAENLLGRWLTRFEPVELDRAGLYLFARSTALLGDLHRDRGAVIGPLSAQHFYLQARSLFTQLDIPRRVAQLDLSLAVLTEMSGDLEGAARRYQALATDERLSRRDRARARLWVGTALSKNGAHDYATQLMLAATRWFDDLGEPDDWSVAHQKLALARRGAGDLAGALRYIGVAVDTAGAGAPIQRVRLDTAHGHILLSDPATRGHGLAILTEASTLAARYGLNHQRRAIQAITATGHTQPARH